MALETTPLLPYNKPSIWTRPPRPVSPFVPFIQTVFQISFIAFGGPQANTALFHTTFVRDAPIYKHQPYVTEATFLELYALGQSLPGPATTKLIMALGATFGGVSGAFITLLVWLLPSGVIMSCAGVWFHSHLADANSAHLVQSLGHYSVGLVAAAFAMVLIAAQKIVTAVCETDKVKSAIAVLSMVFTVLMPPQLASWTAISLLMFGAFVYYVYDAYMPREEKTLQAENGCHNEWSTDITRLQGAALMAVVIFGTLVVALLPLHNMDMRVLRIFWKIGMCVYGGATVVVPLLLAEFVDTGLLPPSVFMAAFGLFGCIPGPMTNLAPFLGAAILSWRGALYGLVGSYLPGVCLQVGLLPFWYKVRHMAKVQVVLQGMNSAAAGLILAGVWMLLRKALTVSAAYAMAVSAGAFILVYKVPLPVTIALHGLIGIALAHNGIGMS